MTVRNLLHLIRIEHWVKNLFLFIPAFFGAKLLAPGVLLRAIAGFIAFSLVASAVYVLNDLVDAKQDRNHPDKSRRPIASGAISSRQAMIILAVLLISGSLLAGYLSEVMLLITLIYFFNNLLYSFYLKHIALVDISLIGIGFLLRVYVGGEVTGVAVSQWLTVMTFLLALIFRPC